MKAYLASGWFTKEQEKARVEMLQALSAAEMGVYSPKDDLLFIPGESNKTEVFATNIKEMCNANFILASTVGKDMGTLFECGVAFATGMPIVYYWPGGSGAFNLMLAESATAVFTTLDDLKAYLTVASVNGAIDYIQYTGDIE